MSTPTDDPLMSVMEQEYSMNSVDPKNMQELTIYVSYAHFSGQALDSFRSSGNPVFRSRTSCRTSRTNSRPCLTR